jgi:hypothetical protein
MWAQICREDIPSAHLRSVQALTAALLGEEELAVAFSRRLLDPTDRINLKDLVRTAASQLGAMIQVAPTSPGGEKHASGYLLQPLDTRCAAPLLQGEEARSTANLGEDRGGPGPKLAVGRLAVPSANGNPTSQLETIVEVPLPSPVAVGEKRVSGPLGTRCAAPLFQGEKASLGEDRAEPGPKLAVGRLAVPSANGNPTSGLPTGKTSTSSLSTAAAFAPAPRAHQRNLAKHLSLMVVAKQHDGETKQPNVNPQMFRSARSSLKPPVPVQQGASAASHGHRRNGSSAKLSPPPLSPPTNGAAAA